ncbi:hypothetical protein EJ06DRAFT_457368, partial [Trichodelitschia bisporula]
SNNTAGPHRSDLANKADPRVDSDMDGSRNAGASSYGPGAHNTSTGTSAGYGAGSNNAGPHSSSLANKLDPRVDSDMDGSRNAGASTYGPGAHNTSTGTSAGYGASSNTAGPHDSNIANKLDPRVDSDRDGSRNAGAAAYGPGGHQTAGGYGTTGYTGTHTGPHDSNIANRMDPMVDSDRDGSRNAGASAYGPGGHNTAGGYGTTGYSGNQNAGPHDSKLANKLDPRVDSDRDGSSRVGGPNT